MKKNHIMILSVVLSTAAYGKGIPNNASANLVLGQQDFVTDTINPPIFTPFNMDEISGVAIDPLTGKVFVADEDGDRVLRFPDLESLKNGAGGEAVLGQVNFAEDEVGLTQQNMNNPNGLFVDHRGRLWIADEGNNRVLMFEMASSRSTFAFADRVFGQADFITNSLVVDATKMNAPSAVWVDMDDRLWVADSGNHRVLRFDSITTKLSGSPANGVLGQNLFTTGAAGTGSSGLQRPVGLAVSSGGELFVSCATGHRILRFDNAATLGNGAGANAVFGQPDFSSTTPGTSATALSSPGGMDITSGDQLWVGDRGNNRVLRYDRVSGAANGAAAGGVIGQPDFTTPTLVAASSRSLDLGTGTVCGVAVDGSGALWVPDEDNARVLRFPVDATKPTLVVNKTPKSVTKKKLGVSGSASDAAGIAKVQYQVGAQAVKTAVGTTSWNFKASLAKGKNKISVWAFDKVDNATLKVVKVRRK